MLFATWNVRTLREVGTLQNLVNQINKYKIDILTLQEMSWER